MIKTENAIFNMLVSTTVNQFFSENKIEPFDVNIEISSDFCKRYSEIRPDLSAKILEQRDSLSKGIGITIPPKNYDDKFTILIREDCAEKIKSINVDCLGVAVHEITHVCDFKDYSRLIGNKDYTEILTHEMFRTWTEFHADLNKWLFLEQFFHDTLDDIVDRILPAHTKYVCQEFDKGVYLIDKLYYIAHFLGRLYMWECQFPCFFTKQVTDKILSYEWMKELYLFLKAHTSIEKTYREFDLMNEIINTAFKSL